MLSCAATAASAFLLFPYLRVCAVWFVVFGSLACEPRVTSVFRVSLGGLSDSALRVWGLSRCGRPPALEGLLGPLSVSKMESSSPGRPHYPATLPPRATRTQTALTASAAAATAAVGSTTTANHNKQVDEGGDVFTLLTVL